MALLMNLCLGLLFAVGLGTAIGLPLTLSSSRSRSAGGGHSISGKTLEITKCSGGDQGGDTQISFGEEGHSFCWNVKEPNQISLEPQEVTESLSKLFKAMWKNGADNWNSKGNSSWKAQCVSGASGWTLTQADKGEYLGYCSGGQQHSTGPEKGIFIEKEKDSEQKINLKLCSGNCFGAKSSSTTGNIKEFEGKQGNWSEIIFLKKS